MSEASRPSVILPVPYFFAQVRDVSLSVGVIFLVVRFDVLSVEGCSRIESFDGAGQRIGPIVRLVPVRYVIQELSLEPGPPADEDDVAILEPRLEDAKDPRRLSLGVSHSLKIEIVAFLEHPLSAGVNQGCLIGVGLDTSEAGVIHTGVLLVLPEEFC